MIRLLLGAGLLVMAGAAPAANVKTSPDLGKAAAACRPNEPGPALLVSVLGLKDRKGLLRLELYPANDTDFLAPDYILVGQGKTFGRVDREPLPAGDVTLCVRLPAAGRYGISLLHDRDRNLKFGLFSDGVGFPGTPRLTRSKPKVAQATVVAGAGLSRVAVTMQYLRGFGFGPLKR
jgi:uncharacterized protein (DUF2141 family)